MRLLLVVLNIGEIISYIVHCLLVRYTPLFQGVKTVTFSCYLSLSLLVPSFSWSYLSLDPCAGSKRQTRQQANIILRM